MPTYNRVMINIVRCAVFLLSLPSIFGQQVLEGVIRNLVTQEVVGGASLRVEGTTKGTYTNARGEFRLPLPPNARQLVVTSLGYDRLVIDIASVESEILLQPSSVNYRSVAVVGDITAEEVIKRASNRVEVNNQRVQTVVSTVYSKMNVMVDDAGLGSGANSDVKASIMETFSTVYDQRSPEPRKHVHILQRRQTRNIPAQDNLLVFDQFFDFTVEEVRFLQTRLVTPLAPDALDEYHYQLLGKEPLGNLMVYRVAFEPKARMYPGFEGTLTIVEGTYQVIGAEFTPTDETAIPFVRRIRYIQRYEQHADSVWLPMYQQISATVGVDVIKGLLSVQAQVAVETHVTDVQVNVPINDSVFTNPADTIPERDQQQRPQQSQPRRGVRIRQLDRTTSVAADADSSRPEFWEQRAYAQQSDEEREAYRVADSIVAAAPPREEDDRVAGLGVMVGSVALGIVPVIDRASITGMRYGGEISATLEPMRLTAQATFGSNGTRTGEVGLTVDLHRERGERVQVLGSVFSRVTTLQSSRSVFGRADFLNLSDVIYPDWSDFYRTDGVEIGVSARFNRFQAAVMGSWHRALNMDVIEAPNRTPIRAGAGNYQTITLTTSYGRTSGASEFFGSVSPFFADAVVRVGRDVTLPTLVAFATAEASVGLRLPTFATGYYPMRLDVDLFGGARLAGELPRQYQFSLLQRYPVLGSHVDLATVPVSAFGGTSYLRAHIEHNFTDLWWRALGLPTFANKRGIDVIGVFDAANVWQAQQPTLQGVAWDGTGGWYMEAGVALARIPTFISELFYLRVDALWPVGGLGMQRGRFGWSIGVSSPLL